MDSRSQFLDLTVEDVPNLLLAFTLLHCADVLMYPRFLDERVQDV